MSYEHKLIKYKTKINLIKNQVGGKDCDIRHSEDLLATSYIKDITDFIPFEKSILHPFRKHPVCSYSIWDKSHTQLYVPTPPEPKDKLYASQKFYIRLHKVYFKSQIKGESEGVDLQAIMWSQVHEKWYELENWPLNDNLLENLLRFLNVYVIHTGNIDSYILLEIRDNDVFFDYILMLIHFVFGVILIFSDGKEEINFCLRWTHFFKLKTCEFFTHKMRFIFIETQVQENRFYVYLARNIGFPKKCDLFKTLANPTIGYTSCIKIIYPFNIVLNLPFGVIYYGLWGG